MIEIVKYIDNNSLGTMYFNKTFKELTTLNIGGKIKLYFLPNSIADFLTFYKFAKHFDYPIFVIGAGSNILASDDDFNGIVVNFSNFEVKYACIGYDITVYAGMKMNKLAFQVAKLNLGGIEFLSGIPGSLGGVVTMNAGAFNKSMSDVIISVDCLDKEGKLITLTNEELNFRYRGSIIQNDNLIVLSARLKLTPKKEAQILTLINQYQETRKKNQPLDTKNAGCTFQNEPDYATWYLIDQVGLRGYSLGGAKISEKHCNFLINDHNATAQEMYDLIKTVKEEVKNQYNIDLTCEWILLNFNE